MVFRNLCRARPFATILTLSIGQEPVNTISDSKISYLFENVQKAPAQLTNNLKGYWIGVKYDKRDISPRLTHRNWFCDY